MCFVQQQCISSVRVSPYPPCSAATPPRCLSPEAVSLTSAATVAQFSGTDGAGQWGGPTCPVLIWPHRTHVCVPRGVFSPASFSAANQAVPLVGTTSMGKQLCSLSPVSEPRAQHRISGTQPLLPPGQAVSQP